MAMLVYRRVIFLYLPLYPSFPIILYRFPHDEHVGKMERPAWITSRKTLPTKKTPTCEASSNSEQRTANLQDTSIDQSF